MEKKRSFLGFLASLFIVFFSANAFAEGYSCPALKKYTSCNTGFYISDCGAKRDGTSVAEASLTTGNSCESCPNGYNCAGSRTCPSLACTNTCTSTNNTTSTQSCTPNQSTVNISNGSCTITYNTNSGSQTCNGKYTGGDNCTGSCSGCSSYGACSGGTEKSRSCTCNTGYYLSSNTCNACSSVKNTSTLSTTSITGGSRIRTCTGNYTGGAGGTNGSSACTGCSADSYTCSCNANYHSSGSGSTCTCVGDTYTISYVLNSGTQASSGVPTSYTYGTGATINGTPTRSGYTFAGWCTDSGLTSCSTSQTIATNATGNKTFYAKWTGITCSAGQYLDGTCKKCPDAYPNSPANNGGGITSCYSNTKSRAWSGSRTECDNPAPTYCASVICGTCSKPACDYVAYSNAAGTGDGTIKSGCSTNNESCKKPVDSVTAKSGSYVNGKTCATCSSFNSSYTKSAGGNITSNSCYLTTDAGKYVRVATGGQEPCPANSYCTGGTTIYYNTGTTTGGSATCSANTSSKYTKSAAGSSKVGQCYLTLEAKQQVASAGAGTSACSVGRSCTSTANIYYNADGGTTTYTGDVCAAGTYNTSTGQSSCTTCPAGSYCTGGSHIAACSSLTGVTIAGGTYTSAAGSSASTACKYTAPAKNITGCASVTPNTVTYTGSKWPDSAYSVSANGGWIIANNNTANATCTQCSGAVYSAGGSATSCTACPTQTNGWSRATGTGWTSYSNCYETQTPANCASGSVKHHAQSATAWNTGTPTLVTTLKSNAGYYASSTAVSCTICSAGSYCPAGATAPAACATGSYTSGTGQSQCTACQSGSTTNGTGQTSCNATCSNSSTYVNAWDTATWSANTVSKLCTVANCKANSYVNGATCSACGANSSTAAANTSTTCTCTSPTPAGYSANGKRDGATTSTNGCTAVTYDINYVLNSGTQASSGVPTTYTYGAGATINGTPTRTYYTFEGWCTDAALTSCAKTQTIAATATGDKTFYAKWSKTQTACQVGKYWNGTSHVTCPSGKYCPGPSVIATSWIGETGCATDCPTDAKGGTVKSAAGSSTKSACYVEREKVTVANGFADQMCFVTVATDVYDKDCRITVTACNVGHYREQVNSTSCAVVNNGYYSAADELARHACGDLNGAATNVTTATNTSGSSSACYNPCSNISIANGTRVPVSTQEFFDGTSIPACRYTTQCNTGYQPSGITCIPKTLTVTLNHNGGTNSINTIYLKYDTGWFSNSGATQEITSVAIPVKSDSEGFSGYLSANNDMIVAESGVLTTNYAVFSENATVTADWTPRTPITCDAGTYYTGTGATCTRCPAGNYCPGVATYQEVGSARGINTCQSLGGTYTHATDAPAATVITSDAGASKATDCYATNLAYKSATNNADGYQTCYYNAATRVYSDSCKNIKVTRCSGGHYRISADAGDCAEVGVGYYSPKDVLNRTACPHLDKNIGVKTFSTTSTEVTQCYRGNIWYEPAGGHSAHRRSCYHIDAPTSANPDTGYSYNCDVSVVVTCDGGYYDDGVYRTANNERDCVAITSLSPYYSPAQSFFTNEPLQPDQELPGSSTKRLSCPLTKTIANGSEQRRVFQNTWVASDYAVCKYSQADCDAGYNAVANGNEMKCETCPANHFCTGGSTTPQTCPIDTVTGKAGMANVGATTTEDCYVERNPYAGFNNGTAKARCTYSSVTRDYTICTVTALTCAAGYYHNGNYANPACIKVGYGFYSPADDMNRHSCDVGQTTSSEISASKSECYSCPAGKICDPSSPNEPKTCDELTGGKYPYSDAGASRVEQCYNTDCPLVANAATMKGRNYRDGTTTCDVDHCKAGFTYNALTKSCVDCPAGMFCGGGDDTCPAGENCGEPKSCATLGDGSWPKSIEGASKPADCYRECKQYNLIGGIAVPVRDIEYYATECEYKGFDNVGNPCEIEDGKCKTVSCKPSYEMVNGTCMACNRDHALSYKNTGNCMVESCEPGWHPYGQKCEADTKECTAPNAFNAEQRWDYKLNDYGICIITECDEGFHISSNACVADIQDCTVEHGIGEREWDHTANTWGECVATSCDPGWTNDPYESNEPTKQCGHCKNKFRITGELAASSYSRGCTISACMYQGELYNLENNECNPICDTSKDGYSDETGTMKWNPSTHKCERTCNPGYVMW